jgi:hypothetical protein
MKRYLTGYQLVYTEQDLMWNNDVIILNSNIQITIYS